MLVDGHNDHDSQSASAAYARAASAAGHKCTFISIFWCRVVRQESAGLVFINHELFILIVLHVKTNRPEGKEKREMGR